MRSRNRFYPPSPKGAPEDLLQPTARYRLQVAVVRLSLLALQEEIATNARERARVTPLRRSWARARGWGR